ncbi:MAG: YfhO family protein, partial [Planctomycetes bacterium]|nr:YfhO family protein [Planctomycetota bacterium]
MGTRGATAQAAFSLPLIPSPIRHAGPFHSVVRAPMERRDEVSDKVDDGVSKGRLPSLTERPMNLDRRDACVFLLLLILPLAYFWRAALGLSVFFHFDIIMQFYPYKAHFMDGMRSGHLPLWCPLVYSGFPLFAEGQAGALYPLQIILYLLMPTPLAYNHATLLHIGLAGGFTYLYLRVLGLTRAASVLGGLVFMFSGCFLARVRHFNIILGAAWLPCLLLLVELFQQRRRWLYIALAGVVMSFLFLASHPYITLYSLLLAAAYLAFHAVVSADDSVAGRTWRAIAALMVIGSSGAGLAAIQILPTYELLNASVRALPTNYLFLTQGSFPPSSLLTFLIPNYFGAPATDTYWGTPSEGFYIEFAAYCGLLPLLLAFVAVRRRRDPHTLFFALLALASLLLAFGGYTILYRLVAHVPLLGSSRVPARFLLLVCFSIAVLAAKGLDSMASASPSRKSIAAMFGLAALFIAAVLLLHRPWLLATSADLAARYGLHGYLLEKVPRIFTQSLRPALIHFAAFAALTIAWFAWAASPRYALRTTHYALPAILITLADLLTFAWHLNPTVSPAVYETPPAAARFL